MAKSKNKSFILTLDVFVRLVIALIWFDLDQEKKFQDADEVIRWRMHDFNEKLLPISFHISYDGLRVAIILLKYGGGKEGLLWFKNNFSRAVRLV